MKDLLRWVGPPDSDADDDDDEEYDDEEYEDEEYKDEEFEDVDDWPYDDNEEDDHKISKPPNILPIKTEAKTGPSVSKKDSDASAISSKASSSVINLVPGSSAYGPKSTSNVPKKDLGSSLPKGSKVCGQGGKLSVCSRCKTTYYCSREHQTAHYASHKRDCRQQGEAQQTSAPPAKKPGVQATTWEVLEQLYPFPAKGKNLDVRIVSLSNFFRCTCEGRDAQGQVRRLAFYSNQIPRGLKTGCVLRLRNPVFHHFVDGSCGVRIEDYDLPNITISDN